VLKGGEAVGLVVVLLSTSSTISTIMPITSPAVAPPETGSADKEGGVGGGSDAMVGYMVGPSLTTPPQTGESETVVGGGVGGGSDVGSLVVNTRIGGLVGWMIGGVGVQSSSFTGQQYDASTSPSNPQ